MKYFFLASLAMVFVGVGVAQAASSGWLLATGDVNAWDDFEVLPATFADKYRAVDEDVCNGNTDGVWVPAARVNDKQAFSVDLSSVPNGTEVSKITVRPCMSANTTLGTSTVGVRVNFDGVDSAYETYTVGGAINGNTPTQLSDAVFSSGTSTLTKSTTTELYVGFKYFGGEGLRVSHFDVLLDY